LTSPAKFVSNSVFIWPFVCLFVGLCLPIWLEQYTNDEFNAGRAIKLESKKISQIFMILVYTMCALLS